MLLSGCRFQADGSFSSNLSFYYSNFIALNALVPVLRIFCQILIFCPERYVRTTHVFSVACLRDVIHFTNLVVVRTFSTGFFEKISKINRL